LIIRLLCFLLFIFKNNFVSNKYNRSFVEQLIVLESWVQFAIYVNPLNNRRVRILALLKQLYFIKLIYLHNNNVYEK